MKVWAQPGTAAACCTHPRIPIPKILYQDVVKRLEDATTAAAATHAALSLQDRQEVALERQRVAEASRETEARSATLRAREEALAAQQTAQLHREQVGARGETWESMRVEV